MAKQQPKKAPDPDLLGRLWNNLILSWRLMADRRVSIGSKLIPFAVIAYILSPIDLIPDLLLPFGAMDDIGVLLLGLQLFIRSAPPGVVDEYQRRVRGAAEKAGIKRRSEDPDVIEGSYQVRDEDK
jgi:uncharacterized membrane protein YkvA (DUF1232 family)